MVRDDPTLSNAPQEPFFVTYGCVIDVRQDGPLSLVPDAFNPERLVPEGLL